MLGEAKTPSNRIATTRVPAKTLQNVNSQCDRRIQEDVRLTFREDNSILLCSGTLAIKIAHVWQGAHAAHEFPINLLTFVNQHSPQQGGRHYTKVIKPAQARDSKRYSWAARQPLHIFLLCTATWHKHPAAAGTKLLSSKLQSTNVSQHPAAVTCSGTARGTSTLQHLTSQAPKRKQLWQQHPDSSTLQLWQQHPNSSTLQRHQQPSSKANTALW